MLSLEFIMKSKLTAEEKQKEIVNLILIYQDMIVSATVRRDTFMLYNSFDMATFWNSRLEMYNKNLTELKEIKCL